MSDRYDKAHAAWVASCGDVLVSKICHQNLLEKIAAVDEMIARGEWKLERGIKFGIPEFTHETASRVDPISEVAKPKRARKSVSKSNRVLVRTESDGAVTQMGLVFGGNG